MFTKMRIVAVNRFYRPDHSATSQLLGDLAEHLVGGGHDVTVITSRLQYGGGELLAKAEVIGGVSVRRVSTTGFGRATLWGRAIDYLSFYVSSFVCILRRGRRGDILIIKTDPPLLTIPMTLAGRLKGMKTVNWCQDLFPEIAASLGLKWAEGVVGRLLRGLRNRSLRLASVNAVLHEKMAERLADAEIPTSRIRVLPNWADREIRPRQQSDLRASWGLTDHFVIGYSGNLGRAHMAETIALLVDATQGIKELRWLFIGGGAGMEPVRQAASRSASAVFQPYQPRELLSHSLSVPDVHLISLDPGCEGYIVPSKMYGVRAAAKPVLFLGDADGAVAREIRQHQAGWVLDPRAPATWEAIVRRVLDETRSIQEGLASNGWHAGWSAESALARWQEALEVAATTKAR
jgi:colanic acid biosynthesis glycosyl transferase WcaI